jgi:hypothetical protein
MKTRLLIIDHSSGTVHHYAVGPMSGPEAHDLAVKTALETTPEGNPG